MENSNCGFLRVKIMSIRERVLDALQKFPETRNDDRLLYLKVLEDMGIIKRFSSIPEFRLWVDTLHHAHHDFYPTMTSGWFLMEDRMKDMPSFESIRRRRQEIQNDEHQFIPTDPDVLAKRRLFYDLCPREILEEEGQPEEILNAVCARCQKRGTERCPIISGVAAVLEA